MRYAYLHTWSSCMWHLNLSHMISKLEIPTLQTSRFCLSSRLAPSCDTVKVFHYCKNVSSRFVIFFVSEICPICCVHFGNFFRIFLKKEIKLLLNVCLDLWWNALKPIAFTPKPNAIFRLIRWTVRMNVAVVSCDIFSQNTKYNIIRNSKQSIELTSFVIS